MNTQKVLAAAAILAAAGTTFAQVSPGAFAPDATDDMESYPGARTFLGTLFAGDVAVGGALSFASVDFGDWLDFRTPGGPITPTSGSKFGTIFGFGEVTLDFTGIGGVTGFGFSASAAGVGADTIEFFDLGGASIGLFTDADGYGPGDGSMIDLSWTSTVAIGSVRLDGPETAFDDFIYIQGDVPAQILLFESANDGHEISAADNLGLNYDLIDGDFVALNADLNNGQYNAAIIHNPCCFFGAGFDAELDTFVSGGGRVHFSYWNMDADVALQGTLGVDSAVDFFAPRPVFDNAGHPSWGGAASPVAVDGTDPWNDNGDSMTGDEVVSTFDSTSGDGATIVSNENRTLTNGFEYDTLDETGVVALLEAQIDWVLNSAPPPPPPGSLIVQFQSGNDGHLGAASATAGITPDLDLFSDFPGLTAALNDPDYGMALVSNPCCFFDAGTPAAFDSFIANGNIAHLSFWNMDADVVLQGAFGVATAIDFFTPRSVHDNVGHPSWGGAGTVNPDAAPSPWNDNGDSMTAAAGGAVVGTHDFAGGDGAIIVANGDNTLFNGFDYDSMVDAEVRALVAAQLGWIPKPGDDCFADCDGDGSLTLFDFLCFQNQFDAGDLAADCDGDGILTLFDFLCFQNEFDAGCD
ncbi:MAG: hypothetical protein NCW75_13695 [Phycisphaera sp.]|nr:MAG: hypothetical protein NCW75_13695 [Phycisphaera sp.]